MKKVQVNTSTELTKQSESMTTITKYVSDFEATLGEKNGLIISEIEEMKKAQADTCSELTKQGENITAISKNVSDFEVTLGKKNDALIDEIEGMKKVQAAEVQEMKSEIASLKELITGTLLDEIKALIKPADE